ncbi:MAG TPA: hypothetical protein VMT46_05675 [Anaerolineaceae bacterium]|nr:hypothetical protein [Anaerolineaceae bacterium]
MKDEKLTIFLSPGELFCIAGSLGLATLPLVGGHYRGRSSEEIREDINRGREVLESRGLIKRFGLRQWEVDSSLTSLVEFIAHPEYALVASSWRKNEFNQQVFLYFKARQCLSLTYKDRFFNLTLYRDLKSVSRYVFTWLGIGQQISNEVPELDLPITDLGALFQDLWAENPDFDPEVLKKAGVPAHDAAHLWEQLSQVTVVSNLTLLVREGERFNREGQLFLLLNQINLWLCETLKTAPGSLKFSPLTAARATGRVDRYLRGKAGEEPAANEEEKNVFL